MKPTSYFLEKAPQRTKEEQQLPLKEENKKTSSTNQPAHRAKPLPCGMTLNPEGKLRNLHQEMIRETAVSSKSFIFKLLLLFR